MNLSILQNKLAIAVTADSLGIVNKTGSSALEVEFWGKQYTLSEQIKASKAT